MMIPDNGRTPLLLLITATLLIGPPLPPVVVGYHHDRLFQYRDGSTTANVGFRIQQQRVSSPAYRSLLDRYTTRLNHSKDNESDPLVQAMIQLKYSPEQRTTIISQLQTSGLWNNNVDSNDDNTGKAEPSSTLRTLTQDYFSSDNASTTTVSTILIHDFQIPPLVAHQTRAALALLYQPQKVRTDATKTSKIQQSPGVMVSTTGYDGDDDPNTLTSGSHQQNDDHTSTPEQTPNTVSFEQRYKSTIVRPVAKRRLAMCQTNGNKNNEMTFAYSLQPIEDYPICQQELQEFYQFMTVPSTDSQEETPIRSATAQIYIRHAKLFLGWYWSIYLPTQSTLLHEHVEAINNEAMDHEPMIDHHQRNKKLLSLYVIFPTKDKVHANPILQYILWLRTTRYIAVSYEANLLRGLCKLLKFRYRKESTHDAESAGMTATASHQNPAETTSFNDIPVIHELRKLHRDANRRQAVAPRVSNEDHKWLSWPDYIKVVQQTKDDLLIQILAYDEAFQSPKPMQKSQMDIQRRRIAVSYQKYLILSFFANVPDRQRTIRELEIGRSLVRVDHNNKGSGAQWCIKHTPEDYKTGKTYGERPPLQLPTSLTSDIDDFIARWRPALFVHNNTNRDIDNPNGENNASDTKYLFLGPRTGTPLTSDAVYQTVSKTCYFYTGKRTNPHLLRDMIVTHVRESSTVTEQQLEALALFMGHSAAIQRKSYDRRTLTKKVAPAIALMEQVNQKCQ